MPQVAFWDCFSGISGDMALGALIDAGLDLDLLRAELRKLQVPDWEIVATRDVRYGIAGTQVKVLTQPQTTHRHLSDIHDILDRGALDDAIRERALAVFGRLAAAEGSVHGMAPDEVHFHEVGALDAIVDVVGVVAGLQLLGVEAVYASPLPLGSGWIEAAHGRIPVPGPAVLALLGAVGAPVLEDATPFELVTPTGAALLAELATFRRPAMRLGRAGYGFGSRDTGRLNAVRLWLGTNPTPPPFSPLGEGELVISPPQAEGGTENVSLATVFAPAALERVVLLETNLDDQPGEQLAYAAEQLMAAGALDVWWQPIGMKKGRAAILLSVLLRPEHEAPMTTLLFRETSSLGIRRQPVERWVCERESRTVRTTWGEIRVKIKIWQGIVLGAAPEYEDCARVAREHDVPLQTVYRAAQRAADDQL